MKVRRYVFVALLCTTVTTFGGAQTAPLRTIGIIEVPRLFNLSSPDGNRIPPDKNFRIELRTRPALESPVVGAIVAPAQLESKEYSYEGLGALVYARDRDWSFVKTSEGVAALQTSHSIPHQVLVLDRRPGWFRVAPADQSLGQMESAWLEEVPVWRFHAVTDEAERRMLAERAWGPEGRNVRTIGTRQVGDALWIEVEVLSHSFCEDPRNAPVVRARGWIPAHAPSGLPNIWFYSRGC